jgi:hypothetical protein
MTGDPPDTAAGGAPPQTIVAFARRRRRRRIMVRISAADSHGPLGRTRPLNLTELDLARLVEEAERLDLFERKLSAHGNDDGLFPGCHQTAGGGQDFVAPRDPDR